MSNSLASPAGHTLQTPQLAPTEAVERGRPISSKPTALASPRQPGSPAPSSQPSQRSSCPSCRDGKLHGWKDYWAAIVLTWQNQRQHLFTSWIHVPLGVTFLLVCVWAIGLAIELAPFRFPSAVLAMAAFFGLLLALDWLSIRFPGPHAGSPDPEKGEEPREVRPRRRFVDPVLQLLAPPCDFCLRNMSVMFTPSFILIPAREVIPGKEIGLLTAWFILSQVLGFVIPVLLHWGIEWVNNRPFPWKKSNAQEDAMAVNRVRRASVDHEKMLGTFAGGARLGSIATGLSGLTAVVTAPISHISARVEGERQQVQRVEMERARQQGDPAVSSMASYPGTPMTDRNVHLHRHHHHHHDHHHEHHHEHHSPRTNQNSPAFTASSFSPAITPTSKIAFEPVLPTAASERRAEAQASAGSPRSSLEIEEIAPEEEPYPIRPALLPRPDILAARRGSRASSQRTLNGDGDGETDEKDEKKGKDSINVRGSGGEVVDTDLDARLRSSAESHRSSDTSSSEGLDAVDRLSERLSNLITPTIYALVFLVGIPLYFTLDFALPLLLGINLLTFIAAITIVPPKIRRFLHPILSCSIATVLIIWAFGAMKGLSLKEALGQYSHDAKYTALWDPKGYSGPVPGAGDVLFSTLDAGIVALAVPMYRYRQDLRENFWRMMTVIIPCAALSLFAWPPLGKLFGLDPIRALAFAARFMSTPLAIELANSIGADESITVILVVVTGIVAAILKEPFFRLMRVPPDDYLCIGLTMGTTAGAIGASSLIAKPRIMAIASLAFVLFGAVLLICAAIPPIVDAVKTLAGAQDI